MSRAALGRRIVIVLGGISVAVSSLPTARAVDSVERFGDWFVQCGSIAGSPTAPPCEIVQTIRRRNRSEAPLRVAFAYGAQSSGLAAHIDVPAETEVHAGTVVIQITGRGAISLFPALRCGPAGCAGDGFASPAQLAAFREAASGVIAMETRGGGASVVPLSFDGFSAALDVMIRRNQGSDAVAPGVATVAEGQTGTGAEAARVPTEYALAAAQTTGGQDLISSRDLGPAAPAGEGDASGPSYRQPFVQLGSFRSRANADRAWADLIRGFPPLPEGASGLVRRADLGELGTWYRLRVGPLRSRAAAREFCDDALRRDRECFVVLDRPTPGALEPNGGNAGSAQ